MHENQVFLNKKRQTKYINWTIDHKNKYLPGQNNSKNIVPGLQPEKVENH